MARTTPYNNRRIDWWRPTPDAKARIEFLAMRPPVRLLKVMNKSQREAVLRHRRRTQDQSIPSWMMIELLLKRVAIPKAFRTEFLDLRNKIVAEYEAKRKSNRLKKEATARQVENPHFEPVIGRPRPTLAPVDPMAAGVSNG